MDDFTGQVIQIKAGNFFNWMGRLKDTPDIDSEWWVLEGPVRCVTQNGKLGLVAIQGDGNFFEKIVYIKVPKESILEITIVDPDGDLYPLYEREAARKKSAIIQSPGIMMPPAGGKIN